MNAREMAKTFGVSQRTARRHIANGTNPDPHRSVGRDGKTYPGSHRPSRSAVAHSVLSPDLVMARNAVRRLARATGFTDGDLAEMEIIATEAEALLRAWKITVEAAEYERSRRDIT